MNQSHKKNICFIANYFKTDVFFEVSRLLSKEGFNSFWIVPNAKQYDFLKSQFPKNQILYIGKMEILSSNAANAEYDLKINELVYGDRVLKEESGEWTYDYLNKLRNVYHQFIQENAINHIVGEVTWAHELLAIRLCKKAKEFNCKFINPHTIRIPNGRFAFFEDEFQSKIIEVDSDSSKSVEPIKAEKPAYLKLNDKLVDEKSTLSYNLGLMKNFVTRTNQDPNDPTLYSDPRIQFRIKSKEVANRTLFKNFVTETKTEELPKDKKMLLFTLHKQPEASIDVIGRYYEDQLNLIKNVWRLLPEDFILLVKEHSNAIGDRDLEFYKAIKNLRNTYLIDHKENSYVLLEKCEAVFTVSGTIAYEAALMGKKSFTFAPTFFNRLSGCKEISWKDFRNHESLECLLENKEPPNLQEFSNWLIYNSFEGIMSDSYGDPRCMEEENIQRISKGISKIIEWS